MPTYIGSTTTSPSRGSASGTSSMARFRVRESRESPALMCSLPLRRIAAVTAVAVGIASHRITTLRNTREGTLSSNRDAASPSAGASHRTTTSTDCATLCPLSSDAVSVYVVECAGLIGTHRFSEGLMGSTSWSMPAEVALATL